MRFKLPRSRRLGYILIAQGLSVVLVSATFSMSITRVIVVRESAAIRDEIIQEIRNMRPDAKTVEKLKTVRQQIAESGASNAEALAATLDEIIEGAR